MLQNLLFCVPKAAVLHGKSVGFASQKSRFRNVKARLSLFNGIIFTKLNLKTLIILLEKNIPEEDAVEHLLALIKNDQK